MALKIFDTLEPQGDFPSVKAGDVLMPDGSRLSELNVTPPVLAGATEIEPGNYYIFGAVDALSVTLAQKDDGWAYEYMFEFVPGADFQGLTIDPAPAWLREPQWPEGKRCVVSIVRGLAVMGCA